ncbi:cytochrome-c peroxidase [Campylobacter geochelonis]|uniref:Cytochrome c551 peroxidase (Cytochrome cperoxidase) (CCP) n=1 Tax=Campylobacter geochelonis TaxID=1780362 RepID=A0A128EE71_9BACT|nr:cytochrome-c peroxidase [Campylobacter geochelonis]QKF70674.1 periplasmic diheme cytochrome c peroxidase [Campylobacter geochelonis]CZE45810.1 cytochrome c551 peroxidase (cytochrome cperoxidase) (CCP) [Campylobacter geochelonis]CZE46831.1 cytochrome c551 peroxidase (cytochrome cperoxidase) (CCP) [Campylobacter geochelonis]CZE50281.1 cytochrome c551 peroxidase (cytochrome cperoxidase) (CCP) [Campylobacter geochelonis]
MTLSRILLCSSLVASTMFAQNLIQTAKDAGLVALPADKAELNKLIEDSSPDSKAFPTTDKRVELGKKLYFEPRISKSGIISCNTCHNLGLGGVDGVPASTGHKWTPNPHHINAPTVYNSVFNSVQFWDGRAAHLAAQAAGPMTADPEMAATPALVEERLNSMPAYVRMFKDAYGEDTKITFDLITTTIGIFERTLVTPSRFDDFLNGDEKALSKDEKKGLELFINEGCTTCHNGVNLGGTMQPFQVAAKYKFADVGDFKGDANGLVKTPILRNIHLTAPYFHNGAIWSLKEAIKTMGSVQLGIDITDDKAESIATFFNSLTGRMPAITYPMFPASTDATPKPELDY